MAKKYKIVVDGVEHIVEVEDYNSQLTTIESKSPLTSTDTKSASKTTVVPITTVTATENSIIAPLQGNLQDIKVSVGQSVNAGDVLVIIEAMKMENEIVAPKDGKVVAIHCEKGTKVNSGDPLLDIA